MYIAMLVNFLIIVFILLIIYQIFLSNLSCIEGLQSSKKESSVIFEPKKNNMIDDIKKNVEKVTERFKNAGKKT